MSLLRLTRLEVGYGGRAILPPIDLSIERGTCWALVGRNGSGKSTTLRTLLGAQKKIGGAVERGAAITYVPQRSELDLDVPQRVREYVRSGCDRGWSFLRPWASESTRVAEVLRETDCEALATRPMSGLSEGQRQRATIARALASSPDLLVLDEPSSAMDPVSERAIFELLDRVRRARDLGVLIASHQMSFLAEFATHAIFVDALEQKVSVGPIAEVLSSPLYRRRYSIEPPKVATNER